MKVVRKMIVYNILVDIQTSRYFNIGYLESVATLWSDYNLGSVSNDLMWLLPPFLEKKDDNECTLPFALDYYFSQVTFYHGEGGDIGLVITLVPKVFSYQLENFCRFQPQTVIYKRGNFVYHKYRLKLCSSSIYTFYRFAVSSLLGSLIFWW